MKDERLESFEALLDADFARPVSRAPVVGGFRLLEPAVKLVTDDFMLFEGRLLLPEYPQLDELVAWQPLKLHEGDGLFAQDFPPVLACPSCGRLPQFRVAEAGAEETAAFFWCSSTSCPTPVKTGVGVRYHEAELMDSYKRLVQSWNTICLGVRLAPKSGLFACL